MRRVVLASVGVVVALIGLPSPTGGTSHADVGPGARRCFDVSGSAGDAAIVNLTPVGARADGYGLLVSSDVQEPPTASNVNYSAGSVAPNVAVVPIGADGQVCFVNAQHSSVHLVADQLGVIDADSYQPATPSGAPQRALDTRAVGVPEPPADPSDIVHGRQLTAANTGLRAAGFVYDVATDTFKHPVDGALRRSGTIRTSRDGQVIANVDVEGAIIVEHDNVTIRNCRVRYDGTVYGIDARSTSPVGTLIEYCDITHIGPEPHEAYGIFLSRGTARYLNIYGWQAGFIAGTDTRIEYSRITDLRAISGTHGTGGSADGGSNISFYRNYIEGNTSAALALYSRSPFHGVSVRENYFDASTRPSFCLNAGDNKNGTGVNTDIKVVGNVFGTTKYPECGQFGTHYRWDPTRPGAQWCDNRLSTGVPVGREVGC